MDFYDNIWKALEEQDFDTVIVNMKKNNYTTQTLGEELFNKDYFEGSEYYELMMPLVDHFLNKINGIM